MPFIINIGILKTNGINQNGNIDIGASAHNSLMANSKSVGQTHLFGDFSPSLIRSNNGVVDLSFSDQDQIASPSAPISNQI